MDFTSQAYFSTFKNQERAIKKVGQRKKEKSFQNMVISQFLAFGRCQKGLICQQNSQQVNIENIYGELGRKCAFLETKRVGRGSS